MKQQSEWVRIWYALRGGLRIGKENLKIHKATDKMPRTIYGEAGTTVGEMASFQKKSLGWLKYGVLAPLTYLVKAFMGKHYKEGIPNRPEFINLKVFDDAFNEAVVSWTDIYLYGSEHKNPLKFYYQVRDGFAVKTLRIMKNLMFIALKADSAYFEFFNTLMFKINRRMIELHGEQPVHIPYKAKIINDEAYFVTNTFENKTILAQRTNQLRTFYDEKGELKVLRKKKVGVLLEELGAGLNCTPDISVILSVVARMKKQNEHYRNLLITQNNSLVKGLQDGDTIK